MFIDFMRFRVNCIFLVLQNPTVIWQIGDFDGTPRGFLNADMIETMQYVFCSPSHHVMQLISSCSPSDTRMHIWGPGKLWKKENHVSTIDFSKFLSKVTYTVGQQDIGFFPMAAFQVE